MEKYHPKRDPKVYAVLSLLGASGCRPKVQTAFVRIDPKELVQIDPTKLGEHSIIYGVAYTADTLKERDYGQTLLEKIHAVNENHLVVEKVTKDGKQVYKDGKPLYRVSKSLPGDEQPSQDALAFIVQEAAGEDNVATYKELHAYFRKIIRIKEENPEYDIFAQPEPVPEKIEKNTKVPARDIRLEDKTDALNHKQVANTEVPSNTGNDTGNDGNCGLGITSALVVGSIIYAMYEFKRRYSRWRSMNRPSRNKPSSDTDDEQNN